MEDLVKKKSDCKLYPVDTLNVPKVEPPNLNLTPNMTQDHDGIFQFATDIVVSKSQKNIVDRDLAKDKSEKYFNMEDKKLGIKEGGCGFLNNHFSRNLNPMRVNISK